MIDTDQAMRDSSVLVHEDVGTYAVAAERKGYVNPRAGSNVCHHFKIRKGDVEEGFRVADEVLQATYQVQRIHHAAMEPHAAVVAATADEIVVFSSTQAPHMIRPQLARLFNLPVESVRVRATSVGGGFGNNAGRERSKIAVVSRPPAIVNQMVATTSHCCHPVNAPLSNIRACGQIGFVSCHASASFPVGSGRADSTSARPRSSPTETLV